MSRHHTPDPTNPTDPTIRFMDRLLTQIIPMTATIRAHALKDVITFIKNNHEPAWVYVWPNGRLRTYPITDLEKLYRIVPDPSRITPAFLDPTPDPSPLIPYLPLLTQHLHSATHASTLDLSPSPP